MVTDSMSVVAFTTDSKRYIKPLTRQSELPNAVKSALPNSAIHGVSAQRTSGFVAVSWNGREL